MTHRRLLLFKWLMVFMPSVLVLAGHILLGYLLGYRAGHNLQEVTMESLTENLLVALLLLVLVYIFVETLFKVLGRLQAEASAREQDIQTMNAVLQERARLSRELHDGAAQLVADLLLRLDTIKELVEAGRSQEAAAEIERLHGVADEIYEDIGESIAGLRANLMERGLICALQDYVDQFEERHQIRTSLQTDDVADLLSPLVALQIFRFIQEALTNVRKHAAAQEVTVTLISDGSGQLKVIVADDGRGFILGTQKNGKTQPPSTDRRAEGLQPEGSGRGLGLTSMRERVEALGGAFYVDSQPGSGARVTAAIPISQSIKENEYGALATAAG